MDIVQRDVFDNARSNGPCLDAQQAFRFGKRKWAKQGRVYQAEHCRVHTGADTGRKNHDRTKPGLRRIWRSANRAPRERSLRSILTPAEAQ